MREQDFSDRLGGLLADICVPEAIANQIVETVKSTLRESETYCEELSKGLQKMLATIRTRMDQIYEDKLDGKISEEFWSKKQWGLHDQELALEAQISALKGQVSEESILSIERVFELA
jgi:hypothetical protein